jgi:acyl-coenzyme A thioesterase PaaI-like protein
MNSALRPQDGFPAQRAVRSAHRVAELVRTTQAPQEILDRAAALLEQVEQLLAPQAWPGPYAAEQLAPPGDSRLVYDPDNLCATVPYSPLLGARNPISPAAACRAEGDVLKGRIRFGALHAGPINTVHGAMVAALFDEILALANIVKGHVGYTRSITVNYLKPTPLGEDLEFSAECAGLSGRNLLASAELRARGEVTATASAIFKAAFRRDEDPYAARRSTSATEQAGDDHSKGVKQ